MCAAGKASDVAQTPQTYTNNSTGCDDAAGDNTTEINYCLSPGRGNVF